MATTKRRAARGVKTRSAKKARRAPARKAGAKKAAARKTGVKKAAGKKTGVKKAAAKKTGAAKAGARKAPAKKAPARKPVAKRAAATAATGAVAALTKRLKAQFARERTELEHRLTETVREIGLLRHHEMRATQLARQLAERDVTIADLRRELEQQQSRTVPAQPDAQRGLDFAAGGTVGINDLDETAALDDEDDDLI